MPTRFAFVGAGMLGKSHIYRVHSASGTKVVAICDKKLSLARKVARQVGARAYPNYKEMFKKESFDALFVVLPPFAHDGAELLAAKEGIPFFVEKPIALDIKLARQVAEEVEKRGVITSVGYHIRYSPLLDRMRKEIGKKTIAMLYGGEGVPRLGLYNWYYQKKLSGGQQFEMLTHYVDLARYVTGAEVSRVHGAGFTGIFDRMYRKHDIEDAHTMTLEFENGTIASFSSHLLGVEWDSLFAVVCHRARYEMTRVGKDQVLLIRTPNENKKGVWRLRTVPLKGRDPHDIEVAAFISAVKKGEPERIRSTYPDAYRTAVVDTAVNQSIKTGRSIQVKY